MKNKIRELMITAMKLKRENARNIYRVLLGEIDTQEARAGKPLTDEQIINIVRKTLEGVKESLKHMLEGHDQPAGGLSTHFYNKLEEEKRLLEELLPKYMDKVDILFQLAEKIESIKAAKNNGQAIGMAIKYLKEKKLLFLGETVKDVIEGIRK